MSGWEGLELAGKEVLGARIRRLRQKNGETLRQVAKGVGASTAHVWGLEVGKSTNPRLSLLKKLAEHFRVTVGFLLGEQEWTPTEVKGLIRELEGLGVRDRRVVELLIRSLKKV